MNDAANAGVEPQDIEQADGGSKAKTAKRSGADYFADFDLGALKVDMNDMFKGGVYFGHQKSRKNPRMDEYIFGTRNGINIIDLQKTVEKLKEAMDFITQTVASGEEVLMVGTKKQAKRLVESAAKRCGAPFVVERWLGGTFTNFGIISERTRYLREGQEKKKQGEYSKYTKFEQMKIDEELERLEKKMGGIKGMTKLPKAIFATSVIEDALAIEEAKKLGIPVVAFVDTNVDPRNVDYPIPANEDAVSSLKLMIGYIAKAIIDGKDKMGAIKAKSTDK